MSSSSTPTEGRVEPESSDEVVPEIVEWLLAGLLAIGGLGMAMAGSAVLWVDDEGLIAEAIAGEVAAGRIDTEYLTTAQLTEIATSTAFWVGIGLVLTGLAVVVVGIVYAVARRRARRSGASQNGRNRLFSSALLGAVATGLLSFIPASPIVGGAIAGYVQRTQATGPTRAGALSGALAAAPMVAILFFVMVGLAVGFGNAGVGLGIVVGLALAITLVATLLYFVGLGALGGYLADVVADDGAGSDGGIGGSADDESASN